MPDEPISTTATTASADGIVAPPNATYATEAAPVAYTIAAHPPTPRDERLSFYGQNPKDVLRALLRTPPPSS